MNLGLGLVGRTTMDHFARVKQQPMDQAVMGFIDGSWLHGFRQWLPEKQIRSK